MRASSRLYLACAQLKIRNPPMPIRADMKSIRQSMPGYIMPTLRWRGGCSSSSPMRGSSPRGTATAVSVSRLFQIICTASSGALPRKRMPRTRASSSPMVVLNRKKMTLRSRLKITLPSPTAATTEAKLSSARFMSPASLATSVPVMPMAMPILAAFKAGASLTPSPVMATTCPRLFRALTILSF